MAAKYDDRILALADAYRIKVLQVEEQDELKRDLEARLRLMDSQAACDCYPKLQSNKTQEKG